MLRQIAVVLPVFLAGIVLGAWAREPVQTSGSPAGGTTSRDFDHAADYQRLEQMISALTEIVNMEVAERRRLEDKISLLSEKVDTLVGETQPANDADAQRQRLAQSLLEERRNDDLARRLPRNDLDEDRFIAAGFAPDVASRLKRDIDQIALDRLYLRDQAVREGWLGSTRYREELRAINARQSALRDDLSPEDYDRYLYALGRPNRVSIRSVLSGSPADSSGLRPGDAILSYDGTRVYSPSEIRKETSQGEAGSMVPVEILRDGQRQVVYLPRGPLGVNMSSSSDKP